MNRLWEPAEIGPLKLKNRVIRSATNEHFSTSAGGLTRLWAETQIEYAHNEVGLVITGHMSVDRTQRADEGQPVIDDHIDISLLQHASLGVHNNGGCLLAQISHSGLKASVGVNGHPAKGPIDFDYGELDTLVQQFVTAAIQCQKGGLDGVQVHTAHGYLLSSFLNPNENRRTDDYGGSLENRFRIIHRIIRSIRDACGSNFAILVKADANGCGNLHELLTMFQKAGVDGVEISGVDFAMRNGEKEPFYLQDVLAIKEGISLPISLVGGVFSRQKAEEILSTGIHFVSFSRALICEPDFIARMKAGIQNESKCLACNNCYSIYRKRYVRCVQHEAEIPLLKSLFSSERS